MAALGLQPVARGGTAEEELRRLLQEGYRARADAPPAPMRLPIDWAADPHGDDNWRVQLNTLRLLDPFIRAHEEGRADAPLAGALDFALDWHRFHLVERHEHAFAWRDMMTGLRALRLAYLAERVRAGAVALDPAGTQALAMLMHAHWQRLTSRGFMRFTNHTVWDLHGLCALLRTALPDDDPRVVAWLGAIGERLCHLVEQQFDERGVHRENSPQYHFVATSMFRALHDSGWYAESSPRLTAALAQAKNVERWMRFPDGRILPIGDSDGSLPSAAALPPARIDSRDDTAEVLDHSGYCLVRHIAAQSRRRWSQLAVRAGFDQAAHRHLDLLSYLWSESGCDIIVDPGKYAYDDGPMREYVCSCRAHNLIEFDGRDGDTAMSPRIHHCVRSVTRQAWGIRIEAALIHAPSRLLHQRAYHFAPGRWLVVVDRVDGTHAHDFVHLTHLAPEFRAEVNGEGRFEVTHRGGGALHVTHRGSVRIAASVRRGEHSGRVQGWVSRGYRRIEPAPVLALSGRADAFTMAIGLSLGTPGQLDLSAEGTFSWSWQDASFQFRPAPWQDA